MSIYSAIYDLKDDEYKMLLDQMNYDGYLIDVDVLDDIEDDIEQKCIKISKVILALQSDLATIKKEMDRLKKLKSSTEANIDSLKEYVLFSMMTLDVKAIDAQYMAIIRRKTPPKLIIDDEGKIDKKYIQTEMQVISTINKEGIKEDIKSGLEVSGCHLESNETIMIK